MSNFFKTGLSDAEIVSGVLAGGRERERAIGAIYDQNRSFLMKFLSNRSNAQEYVKQPEDIVWESVEALISNIIEGKYTAQPDKPLAAYLTTICKNLWHKFLSQESNRQERQDVWAGEMAVEEADITHLIAEQERWSRYLEIFDKAGKNCKQLLTLWLVDNLSGKEMADVLIAEGKFKSEQSVRNAKSDCMEKVTNQLRNR